MCRDQVFTYEMSLTVFQQCKFPLNPVTDTSKNKDNIDHDKDDQEWMLLRERQIKAKTFNIGQHLLIKSALFLSSYATCKNGYSMQMTECVYCY